MLHPDVSAVHCSLKAAALKYGSRCGKMGRTLTAKDEGGGREALIAENQLSSQLLAHLALFTLLPLEETLYSSSQSWGQVSLRVSSAPSQQTTIWTRHSKGRPGSVKSSQTKARPFTMVELNCGRNLLHPGKKTWKEGMPQQPWMLLEGN